MKLNEVSRGIPHIEDLSPRAIIDVVSNLKSHQITEKVDGAQLLFGIDENGFYTSRETKGGARIYNEEDYGITFSSTYMRSVHKLLEQVMPLLKGAGMKPGDQVEAEVLYGRLPNVVPYSADTNYLIFLRTTDGTVNIDRLQQELCDQSVSVSLMAPFTPDGRSIGIRQDSNNWKFARVPVITGAPPLLASYIKEMSKFLNVKDTVLNQSYHTILETTLNKIPEWVEPGTWSDVKARIKEQRENIQLELENSHVFPIKEVLLNQFVRNNSSAFGPPLNEGGWIEGVVLKNKSTGKMVKLVDKTKFGVVREAAWKKRNMLTEHAKGVDSAHSFMSKILIDMATSIGHPSLGTIGAKGYLRKIGNTTEERLEALTENINVDSVKSYWLSLLDIREKELLEDLTDYEKQKAKILEVSGDWGPIYERTLQSFAETFFQVAQLKAASLQSLNAEDLVVALVGKQLSSI